ncbi:hypothetical protein NDU88_002078 [Pleurodeles waltl]|uniref:Uncharacterized protein n=1 Tax=Pleurodeles waltl TaxID=8319 RepID=A0AAV7LEY0_PLEWA|nr:hypothetical protein NDU88_002078 [Pleurodeles waltl]
MVVSGANDPTSREWPGESADSGHRRSTEMPTARVSAILRIDTPFAIHDESLDYEYDRELEEGEIWDDGEHSLQKETEKVKGCKKERSVGVFQDTASKKVQCRSKHEKDIRLNAVGSLQKGCVVGPHSEGSSVWIVGHSFMCWAAKQEGLRPFERQLGFDGSRVKVSWFGKSEMSVIIPVTTYEEEMYLQAGKNNRGNAKNQALPISPWRA